MQIECDFIDDVRQHYVHELASLGGLPVAGATAPEAAINFFSVSYRLIVPKPRRVFLSEHLRQRLATHAHAGAVETIKNEVEKGDDLRPRLSRRVLDPTQNDLLFNEWGIHHLHVNDAMEADGFVKRGGPLLYVRVDGDTAYFIDLLGHGNASFANIDLVEILHREWPESIADFRERCVRPGSLRPTLRDPNERQAMRHFAMMTQVADGTVYTPIGGSNATDGTNLNAVGAGLAACQDAVHYQEEVERLADRIAAEIEARREGSEPLKQLRLQLVLGPVLGVRERQTGVFLRF